MSDAAFLAGIVADPADRVRRLVYADWLDDHADPRGELVRVEEAMRDLPAFADEFWALKARRNELRPPAGADWLAAMRYGVDALPVFAHGVPADPRGRWRLIRELLERWHGIPMPDCGGRSALVAAAQARLGQPLGAGVQEWLALTADLAASGYDQFHRPADTFDRLTDGQEVLRIVSDECRREFGTGWAIPRAEVGADDPRTRGFVFEYDERCQELYEPWDTGFHRLTDSLFENVFGYPHGPWSLSVTPADEPEFLVGLAELFPPPGHLVVGDVYEVDGLAAQVFRRTDGLLNLHLNAAHPVPDPTLDADDEEFRAAAIAASPPQSRHVVEWAWALTPAPDTRGHRARKPPGWHVPASNSAIHLPAT